MKSTERVLSYRERQAKLDRKKKEFYLTKFEHIEMKAKLKELRGVNS